MLNTIHIGLLPEREAVRFRILIGGAILISLLLHVIAIGGLSRIPVFSPGVIVIEPPERSVRLWFIESPERIEEVKEEPLDTDLISDRSSLAQDVIPDRTSKTEAPRSVGTVPERSIRKVPAGEPGEIEAPARDARPPADKDPATGETGISEAARREQAHSGRISARAGDLSPIPFHGNDKYYSPEAESPEGRTRILKQIAYNARSTAVGEYMARMMPRVVNLWHFIVMTNIFEPRSTQTHILFKIMPDGSLGKLVVNEHDGPDLEMRYSLNAVEQSQPYEPLNDEIMEYIQDDGLWIEFHFRYH